MAAHQIAPVAVGRRRRLGRPGKMGLEAPIGNPLLVVDSSHNSSQAITPINKVHFLPIEIFLKPKFYNLNQFTLRLLC
jgi:hypothetical protein